jgi:hypothetical protein
MKCSYATCFIQIYPLCGTTDHLEAYWLDLEVAGGRFDVSLIFSRYCTLQSSNSISLGRTHPYILEMANESAKKLVKKNALVLRNALLFALGFFVRI